MGKDFYKIEFVSPVICAIMKKCIPYSWVYLTGRHKMAKSLEQVVAEGLIADCSSLEELYVLWQTVHHMEEDGARETCYK